MRAMDIRFLGHATFELSEGDTRVLIDPFITGNITFSANSHTMAYQDTNGLQLYEGLTLPEPSSLLAACGLAAATLPRRPRIQNHPTFSNS